MTPKRRIISLSLPKSGTTTLAEALRHAGLSVADWRVRRHDTDNTTLHDQLVGELMYADYFATGDPLARLGEFDAVTEMTAVNKELSLWPQCDFALLCAIAEHHPSAKFVLSLRDPVKVAASMMNWNNLGKQRLPRADVPGMPRGYGTDENQLIRWIEGHYTACMQMFRGSDSFFAYELDDPEVTTKLSTFLELPLGWWGKANTTDAWRANQRQNG